METALTILFAIGTFASLLVILVVVHELGHFATARAFGIKVQEFGVGFPPRLFGVYTGRTIIRLHIKTRFIGFDDPTSLQPGQRVKVGSIEDEEYGLIAVEVERHRKRRKDEEPSHFNRPVDHILWHEGKVRSAGEGYIELADMLYSVNLIPLGGFVRLAGESNPTVPQSLASKKPAARIIVLAAGALMNALLPLLIFTILFMLPDETETGRLAVAEVAADGPAARAGIQPGDIIAQANGQPLERTVQLTREVNLNGSGEMTLLLDRNGRPETVTLAPDFDPDRTVWAVGIRVELTDARTISRSMPIWEAVPASFTATWELLVLLKQTIGGMIAQGVAPQLSGPIGIAQLTGEASRDGGFSGWLTVGILLSVNLAILNILPFPMLDGGRIVFVAIEWLRRGKRISPEKEGMVHLIGLAVLLGGIILISANDIRRLLQGISFL